MTPDFRDLCVRAEAVGLELLQWGRRYDLFVPGRCEQIIATLYSLDAVATYLRGVEAERRTDGKTCLACPTCGALWPVREVPEGMRAAMRQQALRRVIAGDANA